MSCVNVPFHDVVRNVLLIPKDHKPMFFDRLLLPQYFFSILEICSEGRYL